MRSDDSSDPSPAKRKRRKSHESPDELRLRIAEVDAMIESVQEGVVLFGLDQRPRRSNDVARRIFGWDTIALDPMQIPWEERAAIYDMRLANEQPFDSTRSPVARALAGETLGPIEVSLRRPDHSRIIISMRVVPLRDATTGAILGAVGTYRDMTEQYRLDRMREEFLNMASHELRTPLTSMVIANYILQSQLSRLPGTEEMLQRNMDVAMQIKRLSRLANNLLDLTSLIGDRFHITTSRTDVVKVMQEAIEENRYNNKRDILIQGLDEPVMGDVDKLRLGQVMLNLLSNAQVHSPNDTPIEITATLVGSATMPRLRVAVRDHGTGIPADKLPQIFDRFSFVEESPAPFASNVATATGLGFGLYLARAIIEDHHGTIGVDSEVGEGSTFTFEIPVSPQKDAL
jgi:signal transduction histidine kinase